MGQTLEPQQQIAHYRVTAPLGAGGMGEVYLARDETLERNVALKILPPALVANEQRLRRFILEAKSASSLNHPNIVTIHQIGSAEVRGPDGEPPAAGASEPVHYIAMEFVQGETLGEKIHREKSDLRTLVGYLGQVAEGLAKAHAAGIVHRDLKPGNVMVTTDGFAKVLDFGLAKLTERSSDSEDVTATAGREALTGQGMVVGTAAYMSPEQVAGRAVDARSDIFSFGCMLYEAAARQRPFVGDTTVDTLHKILNEKPKPVEELNPRVPADLRRVIRRCLAKSPEQRYQSVKDVAIELRELADQWETLPISGTSDSGAAGTADGAAARQRRGRRWALVGSAAVALVAATAVIAWFVVPRLRTGSATGSDPFQTLKITSVISDADLREAALSPDGRYLAYVKVAGGDSNIQVRQVATGSDVPVVHGGQTEPRSLTFSPDGAYLYYLLAADPDAPATNTLFMVPSLGGSPLPVLRDVDTAVAFSPDGRRFAFLRQPAIDEYRLLLFDLRSRADRVVTSFKTARAHPIDRMAWSSDGRKILTAFNHPTGPDTGDLQVVAVDAETGDREVTSTWPGFSPGSATWLPEDRLVVAGFDPTMNTTYQMWQFQLPGGTRRRVTNDQSGYFYLSASADGAMVAASRSYSTNALWGIGASGEDNPRQLYLGVANPLRPVATADGTLVFWVRRDDADSLWSVKPDGSGLRQVTPPAMWAEEFWSIPGRNAVVFRAFGQDLVSHIWRVDTDGGNLIQLTRGGGESLLDVSRDGRECLIGMKTNNDWALWRLPLDGTTAAVMVAKTVGMDAFSPDGRLVAHRRFENLGGRWMAYLEVIPRDGGSPVASLEIKQHVRIPGWSGDASALAYVTNEGGVETLMRWPIAGGDPTPVFRFPHGRIHSFRWSGDGRDVLFQAEVDRVFNLWLWRAGATVPRQLTRFPSGEVGAYGWSPDGRTVYFSQGHQTRDIVLIRGIK